MSASNRSLAKALWTANQDLARACLDHPFVRGLGDGSLERSKFQGYVAQDAYFLDAFARAYAFCLAQAPDRNGVHAFADLVQGVLEELKLHAGYARRWTVDLTGVSPIAATLNYTGFLLAVAQRGMVGETCAAMTPCMRLYAHIGQTLARRQKGHHEYSDWIRTYAAPEFEQLVARLESLLDRYAEDSPQVRDNYRKAMTLELSFFEATG